MTYPCPFCHAQASTEAGCTGCGRPPDPEAAEVTALNQAIPRLTAEAESARRDWAAAVERLGIAVSRRDALAARVRARLPVGANAAAAPTAPGSMPARPARVAEASGRTVQTVLFLIGGLLLGSAAVVFTAVAWASFGVAGRAAVLALITLVVLALPPLALRRRLTGTAETFAALGLLLVLLDGYAAWYVNLAGVADALTSTRFAGVVCASTAAFALGYRRLAGLAGAALVGPSLVALAVAQPVAPLLLAGTGLGPAGWAGVGVLVTLANLAVLRRAAGRPLLVVPGWLFAALAWTAAGGSASVAALAQHDVPGALRASVALLLVAAVTMPAARLSRSPAPRQAAAAVLALAAIIATYHPFHTAWPALGWEFAAVVVAVAALAARAVPAGPRSGPVAGVLVAAGVVGLVAVAESVAAAADTVMAALPVWRAERVSTTVAVDLWLPAAVVLVAGTVAVLLSRAAVPAALGGAVLVALAVPASVPLPWWAPSAVDGVVLVALAIVAALSRSPGAAARAAGAATLLGGHAVLAALAARGSTIAVFALLTVVATGLGAAGRAEPARAAGWLMATASAAGLALSTALAAGVGPVWAAFWVLAAAATALGASTVLGGGAAHGGGGAPGQPAGPARRTDARVLETAAHAAAAVAALLALRSLPHLAAVCTVWGVALGLRALWPGEPARSRLVRVIAGSLGQLIACWLLLIEGQVAVLEAYTAPLAGAALVAGWLAARHRPDLHSWLRYGPALLAAFVPSLVIALAGEGTPVRRLVLGLAAAGVLLTGSVTRRQAPVVLGGAVLTLLAVHETVLVWELIPRWIPLATGGLVLVGVAMTYERRRRDVGRLRVAVGGMR